MSTESQIYELGGKLAIELIPKALAGQGIPEPVTRIVLEAFIGALKEEQNKSDEKLRRLVGSYYQSGTDYLTDARRLQGERREEWIKSALGQFVTASHVEDALLAAKSQFFVGARYDLMNESTLAKEWYERAYRSAAQLAAQGHDSAQQLVQFQQFMNSLSRVLLAHGSTLGQKPSSQLSSRTSTLLLTRQPAYGSIFRAFQIILDNKKVGAIRQGKSFTLEIQPGYHILFLRIDWVPSSQLTFYVAPGEEVTFLCKADFVDVLLWKQ